MNNIFEIELAIIEQKKENINMVKTSYDQFKELINSLKFSYEENENGLNILTPPIMVEMFERSFENELIPRNIILGIYEINILLKDLSICTYNNFTVKVKNKHMQNNENNHPHMSTGGNVCLGGNNNLFNDLLHDNKIYDAFMILYDALCKYSADGGPYYTIDDISFFPTNEYFLRCQNCKTNITKVKRDNDKKINKHILYKVCHECYNKYYERYNNMNVTCDNCSCTLNKNDLFLFKKSSNNYYYKYCNNCINKTSIISMINKERELQIKKFNLLAEYSKNFTYKNFEKQMIMYYPMLIKMDNDHKILYPIKDKINLNLKPEIDGSTSKRTYITNNIEPVNNNDNNNDNENDQNLIVEENNDLIDQIDYFMKKYKNGKYSKLMENIAGSHEIIDQFEFRNMLEMLLDKNSLKKKIVIFDYDKDNVNLLSSLKLTDKLLTIYIK